MVGLLEEGIIEIHEICYLHKQIQHIISRGNKTPTPLYTRLVKRTPAAVHITYITKGFSFCSMKLDTLVISEFKMKTVYSLTIIL